MSYVEVRNQKRVEEIKAIRALIIHGDLMKIKVRSGKSYRTVIDTLDEDHNLFSPDVIKAAWEYLMEEGRVKDECHVKQVTTTH